MTFEIEHRGDCEHVCGEMTIYNAAALKESLLSSAAPGPRCIDLAAVSEFDTAGLQLLLMVERVCVAHGQTFQVRNPSPAVRQAMDLVRPAGIGAPAAEGVNT